MYKDSHYHFAAGFLLAFIGGFVSSAIFGASKELTLLFLWLVPVLGAIGKEIVDSTQPNNRFNWRDAFATILGACVLCIPGTLIYLFT